MLPICFFCRARRRIELPELRQRTLGPVVGQVVRVHDTQVDQLVQPLLFHLLPPQNRRHPPPARLQEVTQEQIRVGEGRGARGGLRLAIVGRRLEIGNIPDRGLPVARSRQQGQPAH